MSTIFEIYPFWDITKLKLTHVKSTQRWIYFMWKGIHRRGKPLCGGLQPSKNLYLVNFNVGIFIHLVKFNIREGYRRKKQD